jgi:hypothetical protein
LSAREVCFSELGNTATGVRPGSDACVLLFEVAAVVFTASGQSFIMSCGPGANDVNPAGCIKLRTTCFFVFFPVQQ